MALNTKKFIKNQITKIKNKVGKERAICATSGGVDSMVCAFLAHRALDKNLIALLIRFLSTWLNLSGSTSIIGSF